MSIVNPGDGRCITVYLVQNNQIVGELRVNANTVTTSFRGVVYRRVGDTKEFRAAE